MEVEGDFDEPQVKRMNFEQNSDNSRKSRIMVADRLDMAQRLGKRFDDLENETRVHDRLGTVMIFDWNFLSFLECCSFIDMISNFIICRFS